MSSGFESTFKKLLTPPRSAKIVKKSRGRNPDLGSTEGGKAQFRPVEPIREDAVGGLNIREIPAGHTHASKAHRGRKSVRKVGVTWR